MKRVATLLLVAVILTVMAGCRGLGISNGTNNAGRIPADKETLMAGLGFQYDPTRPISFKSNNKWGFMDTHGSVVVEPLYDSVGDFWGDYAVVTVQTGEEPSDAKQKLIDREGNVILASKESGLGTVMTFGGKYYKVDWALYNEKLEKISGEEPVYEFHAAGYYITGFPNDLSRAVYDVSGNEIIRSDKCNTVNIRTIEGTQEKYLYISEYVEKSVGGGTLNIGKVRVFTLPDMKEIFSAENVEDDKLSSDPVLVLRSTHVFNSCRIVAIKSDKIVYDKTVTAKDIYGVSSGFIDVWAGMRKQGQHITFTYDRGGSFSDRRYDVYDVKQGKNIGISTYETPKETDKEINALAMETLGYTIGLSPNKAYLYLNENEITSKKDFGLYTYIPSKVFQYFNTVSQSVLILGTNAEGYSLVDLNRNEVLLTGNGELRGATQQGNATAFVIAKKEDTSFIAYNIFTEKQADISGTIAKIGSNHLVVREKNGQTQTTSTAVYNFDLEKIVDITDNSKSF